ncbi:MAG: hypothetical protein RIS70_1964 [Planctomycetota bacterium]|jgi:hypothetical protein
MSGSAIVFMAAVWGLIIVSTGYCFYRVLTSKSQFQSED